MLGHQWLRQDHPPNVLLPLHSLINTLRQRGNITGAYFWAKAWGPTYNESFALCALASLASISVCFFMRRNRLNREIDSDDELCSHDHGPQTRKLPC